VYAGLVRADPDDPTGVAGLGDRARPRVRASALRTYHSPLATQADFITALRAARALADRASRDLGLDVYVYSVFHVFFEQYLGLAGQAARLLLLPLAAVVGACGALTASPGAAFWLLVCLCSTLLHLAGAMALAGMQINAVSLVNLAMALGIAVEFHAHVLHAFLAAGAGAGAAGGAAGGDNRRARARTALRRAGAPVASGITLTKLAGVGVLAFSRTRIFEVYYFRLYLALVAVGAWHGLVLLPMALSRWGPPPFAAAGAAGAAAVAGAESAAEGAGEGATAGSGGGGGGAAAAARRGRARGGRAAPPHGPQQVDLGAGAAAAAAAAGAAGDAAIDERAAAPVEATPPRPPAT